MHEGTAGWHVITPLVLSDGRAVLVNRGWVPLEMDAVPVPAAPPPGPVTVSGWVGFTRLRQSGGATEPEGRLTQIARVDVDRLQEQMPYRAASGLHRLPTKPGSRSRSPWLDLITTDEGPHLLYAIEWFSFTLISVVGYFFLLRRAVRRSGVVDGSSDLGQALDDGDVASARSIARGLFALWRCGCRRRESPNQVPSPGSRPRSEARPAGRTGVTPPIIMPVMLIVSSAGANEAFFTSSRLRTSPLTSSRSVASTTQATWRPSGRREETTMVLAERSSGMP